MKKATVQFRPRAILAVTAALVLTVAGGMVYAGTQTQSNLETQLGQLKTALEATGLVRVEEKPLRRTLMGGTQETVLTLETGETPAHLTIFNRISNGPFPGLRAFGAAVVDTELRFDPPVQAAVNKAFKNKQPFIRTVVKFGGDTVTNVVVPSGSVSQDGGTLSWKALSATVRGEGPRAVIEGRLPGVTYDNANAGFVLSAARLNSDTVLAPDGLGLGKARFDVGQIEVRASGETVSLSDAQVGSETRANGNTIDVGVNYGVGRLKSGGTVLSDLRLGLGARHLDRAALLRLSKLSGRLGAKTLSETATRDLMVALTQLLNNRPEFSVDPLSLRNAGGEVRLGARASLTPGAPLDPNALLGNPAALLERLNVTASGSAPDAALRELLSTLGPELGVTPDETLQDLRQNGLVTLENGVYRTTFSLNRNGILLNGAPLR